MNIIKRQILNSKLLEISSKFVVKVTIKKCEYNKFEVDFYFDGEHDSACTACFETFLDIDYDSECDTFDNIVFYCNYVTKHFDDKETIELYEYIKNTFKN